MAQNVTIAGRQYSAVPAIDVPKTGGGTATFTDVTDTTRIADDVRQGKYFFTASGVLTLGTATGGGGTGGVTQDQDGFLVLDDQPGTSITVEPITITQNGTTTAPAGKAYSPVTVNVSGGGGASNIVQGSFTAGTAGSVQEVSVNYSGSGYPLFIGIYPSDGYASGSTVYATDHQYAIIEVAMFKAYPGGISGSATYGSYQYKSAATGTANTATRINGTNAWGTQSNPTSSSGCVVIRDKDGFAVLVSDTSFGFLSGAVYKYIIVYSS